MPSSRRLLSSSRLHGADGGWEPVPLVAGSAMERVERSWRRVSSDLDGFGIDFLARLFLEVPEALALFPFGRNPDGSTGLGGANVSDIRSMDPSDLRKALSKSPAIVAHCRLVTREVGQCVLGLSNLDEIVPRLRSLGRMHGASGVRPGHYDVFFRCLVEALRDALGPEEWTEDTEEAWRTVHSSLMAVMKQPTNLALDAEMPGRWAVAAAVAGAYMALVTPFRMAGFIERTESFGAALSALDGASAIVFALELVGHIFLSRVRLPKVEREQRIRELKAMRHERTSVNRAVLAATRETIYGVKFRAVQIIKSLGMDQVVTWPNVDLLVLLSFPLQNIGTFFSTISVPSKSVGVHWTRMLGLLRIIALVRALYAVRCVGNCLIIYKKMDSTQRSILRITRLLATIAYVVHLSACLWFLVAKIELGPGGEASSSSFFPDKDLFHSRNVLNAYTRAVHWAWVQLAGIGDVDSTPVSTLECLTMLIIHVCGATLYAIATGNVVSVLEGYTAVDNEIGDSAADLSDFMQDAKVPSSAQARIMRGYAMNSVISADGKGESESDFPEETVSALPWHLRQELRAHALADAMARRDRIMERCPHAFRFALIAALREDGETLIPGDFLFRKGDPAPHQVYVVESGSLAVTIDGQLVRMLRRGDILGVPWLSSTPASTNNDSEEETITWGEHNIVTSGRVSRNVYCQMLWGEETVGACIRATENTTLAVGFSYLHEVQELRRRFPEAFAELDSEKEKAVAYLNNISRKHSIVHAKAVAHRMVTRYRDKKNDGSKETDRESHGDEGTERKNVTAVAG